jgi:hypothetical protein
MGPLLAESKDGENAKYLKLNLEEAKKLLAAASKTNIEIKMFSNSEQTYGPVYLRSVEVLAGFFGNAGIKVTQSPFVYTEFLNNYYFGYRSGASTQGTAGEKKGYNGVSIQAERPYASAVNLMLGSWHSTGGAFHGLTDTGNNAFAGDSKLDAMIEKAQGEFDQKAQISLTHEIVRYMTGQTYFIPRPVANRSYELFWPAVANQGIKAKDIPSVAFSVGEEELAGIDTKPLLGHLAAWNYFQSVDTPINKQYIAKWHAFTKNPKRTFNDPMEAHVIGFAMWVKAVEKVKSTDPDKVIDALPGIEAPNLTGGISKMLPNHHITKPVLIGEVRADGQFDVVWKTPGLVPGDAWSKNLDGSKDLIADWVKLKCGNYNTKTNKCGS